MDDRVLIEACGLTRVFPRRRGPPVRAVDGVDIRIRRGEFVVVIGRSGCGKSTLLGLLGGLDRPTSGLVRLFDRDLGTVRDGELARLRREHVGFVFQDFHLLPAYTALENVEMALAPAPLSVSERRDRAEFLLRRFEILHRQDHLAGELSLGEQQRVAVARALANRPGLLLADEPTGGVDAVTAREMVDILVGLHREEGLTLVVVTHGSFPVEAAGRVLGMKEGRLVSREEADLRS